MKGIVLGLGTLALIAACTQQEDPAPAGTVGSAPSGDGGRVYITERQDGCGNLERFAFATSRGSDKPARTGCWLMTEGPGDSIVIRWHGGATEMFKGASFTKPREAAK